MNPNDRKMAVIGFFVVIVALAGAISGGSTYVARAMTETTYDLIWSHNTAQLGEIKDTTKENSETKTTFVIKDINILKVTVKFSYKDDIPALGGANNDEFSIEVTSPEGETKSATVNQDGTATVAFEFPAPKENKTIRASSLEEAAKMVNEKYTSLAGTGNYTLVVKAGNCPGRTIGILPFDRDTGNDWTVSVEYEYYTVKVAQSASLAQVEG